MRGKRYKPVGWRGEPHRHYLAAKGIKTNRNYFKFTKDTTISSVENPGKFKSNLRVEKVLMSPQEAESLLSQAIGGDIPFQKRMREKETQKMIDAHESGKALPSVTIYYRRMDNGEWEPDGYDRDSVIFAALETGQEDIPVTKVFKRPFKSTGLTTGEFEFSDREKELAKRQREVIDKAGGFTTRQTGNIVDIGVKDKWKLTDEEKELLDDENIRDSALIDTIVEPEYEKDAGQKWWYQ